MADLTEKGIYLLSDSIDDKSVKDPINWIFTENLKKDSERKEHLTLIINSYGGAVSSGFALIDTMMGSQIPVWTIGLGLIASCGLLIFMSGAKGHRIITENTEILTHQFAAGSYGKEHELLANMARHSHTADRIIGHYKKCTGLSKDTIRKELLPASDIWLTPKQALEYNLCDQVKEFHL